MQCNVSTYTFQYDSVHNSGASDAQQDNAHSPAEEGAIDERQHERWRK